MAESDSNTAVIEEVQEKRQSRQSEKSKPADPQRKPQPPFAVVVLNDDDHTYEYVIEVLQKTFGYDLQKSYLLAREVDLNERAIVWSGPRDG